MDFRSLINIKCLVTLTDYVLGILGLESYFILTLLLVNGYCSNVLNKLLKWYIKK